MEQRPLAELIAERLGENNEPEPEPTPRETPVSLMSSIAGDCDGMPKELQRALQSPKYLLKVKPERLAAICADRKVKAGLQAIAAITTILPKVIEKAHDAFEILGHNPSPKQAKLAASNLVVAIEAVTVTFGQLKKKR